MKRILFIIIMAITYNSYSQISSFDEGTNLYIIEFLKNKKQPDDFGTNPLLVIDGKPILKENMSKFINLKSENITDINSISKKSETGKVIWGENAKDGVIFITTNFVEYPESSLVAENSMILFILDNKIISKEEAYALDPANDIQTATIYKNSNKFLLFNKEEYDGIIVFTSIAK